MSAAKCAVCGDLLQQVCPNPICGSSAATAAPQSTEDIVAVGRGLVYLLGDRVCMEIPNLGQVECPPDVARRLAAALLKGADMIDRGVRATQAVLIT